MVKTNRLKHPYLWFQSVFNSSACNCCGRAVCIIGKTHEAPQQVFRLLFYSLSYFIGAAGFLLSKVLARKICQMLVLTKINTVLACLQMLAKTILYPSKESQQAMAILKAGKLEESTHGATTQKLITSLNRGGLWSITMPAQRIFVKIQKHFRLLTPNINLQGINLSGITR